MHIKWYYGKHGNGFDYKKVEKARERSGDIKLGISDRETVKSKLIEFVQMSNDPNIIKLFSNYIKKHNADYTKINFRLIAIDMIRFDFSQSEMATVFGLTPRTLSVSKP